MEREQTAAWRRDFALKEVVALSFQVIEDSRDCVLVCFWEIIWYKVLPWCFFTAVSICKSETVMSFFLEFLFVRFAFVPFPTGPSLLELGWGVTPHEKCGAPQLWREGGCIRKSGFLCFSRLHANKSRSSGEDAEDFCVLDTTAN